MDEAKEAGLRSFDFRIKDSDHLHGVLTGELENMKSAGFADLAKLIEDALAFEKKIRLQVAKMKLGMYDDFQVQKKQAGSSLELMKMFKGFRNKMSRKAACGRR